MTRATQIKNLILFFITQVVVLNLWSAEVEIKHVLGVPVIEYLEGGAKVSPKIKSKLKQSFRVSAVDNQLLQLQISEKFNLVIFPNSKIKIEGFENEKNIFEVKKIVFSTGRFYIQNFDSPAVLFESSFFSWQHSDAKKYEEFYLDLNLEKALFRVCAGETGLQAHLFELETIKKLQNEQGAEFQGVIEKNEIAFDFLLNNRKIPKGEWKSGFKCDFDNILKQVKDVELKVIELNRARELKIKKAKALKKAQYDQSLCHEPNGQFNQCWWVKKKTECFRYRCNAEGKWSDQFQLPLKDIAQKCPTQTRVANCDY